MRIISIITALFGITQSHLRKNKLQIKKLLLKKVKRTSKLDLTQDEKEEIIVILFKIE